MSLYTPLFKALNDENVQYIIVGGLATVLHGYARFTADIDLVINLNQAEAEKAIKVITSLGLKPSVPVDPMQFTDKAIRDSWSNDKNMLVFSFFDPDNPLMILDVFIREPFPFDEMLKRIVHMNLGELSVPVCAINDLIEMKKKAGRPKDLEDIKYLESLQNSKNED
jgi:predicted nucleotidyltransferase